MYTKEDLDKLLWRLSSSKNLQIKKLKVHISFVKDFSQVYAGTPDEKIRAFLFRSFFQYQVGDPDIDWIDFVFKKPLEDMPLCIKDDGLTKFFALWRLSIGK